MATGGRPRSVASKPARRASIIPCAAASLAMFLIGMDTFIVNVALPTIGTELHANMAAQQWIVDGFTLAFAALLLLAGNLSDRFGAKRAFMAGTAGFAVSSLICALAVGAGMLVLGRTLLGVSAAPVLPSSMSVIREAYPREADRSRALAIWGIGGSLAAAVGPILGGALAPIHWSLIFSINIPFCLAIVTLCLRLAPSAASAPLRRARAGARRRGPHRPHRWHHRGRLPRLHGTRAGCAHRLRRHRAGGLRLLADAGPLSHGAARTLPQARHAGGGVRGLRDDSLVERRDLPVHAHPAAERRPRPLASGLVFQPSAITCSITNMLSDRLSGVWSTRRILVVGIAILSAGYAVFPALGGQLSAGGVAVAIAVAGSGGGLMTPTFAGMVLRYSEPSQAGIASAVFNTLRQVGGAVGMALFGALARSMESTAAGVMTSFSVSLTLMALLLVMIARLRE